MKYNFHVVFSRVMVVAIFVLYASKLCTASSGTLPSFRKHPIFIQAQLPLTEKELEASVSRIISASERHFKKGKLFLEANRPKSAREEFDLAVDQILDSGVDVRRSIRLQTYYLELVERIYREEVTVKGDRPRKFSQTGLASQEFEPSPLDELSKLVLTSEELNKTGDRTFDTDLSRIFGSASLSNPLIQQFINYHQGRGRNNIEKGFRYSVGYMPVAKRIFEEVGVPSDLAWLAQVVSQWNARAYSQNGAYGLWQFNEDVANYLGLRRNEWVDERLDFEKSTRAAATHLKNLASHYGGNWELAIGAFIDGPANVDRAIARAGAANFWLIYPYIPQDTRNYVPSVLATILIAKNPSKYGFAPTKHESPLNDSVNVPPLTNLRLIASLSHLKLEYLRSINPHILRDVTPPNEVYRVYVPAGRAQEIASLLQKALGRPKPYALPTSLNEANGNNKSFAPTVTNGPPPLSGTESSENSKCNLTVDNAPELRGFHLGMSPKEALANVPDLTFKGPKNIRSKEISSLGELQDDLGTMTITIMRGALPESRAIRRVEGTETSAAHYYTTANLDTLSQFDGVNLIGLWFLDGQLSSLIVEYESGINWASVAEFTSRVSEKLKLSGTWRADKEDRDKQILGCDGFAITATVTSQNSSHRIVPTLVLKETNKWDIFLKRKLDMIRRLEQQKKDLFRP